jgi:hypothetical protein
MTTNQPDCFISSLQRVLKQLNKSQWQAPLAQLSNNFQQLPDVCENNFDDELLNVLWSLVDPVKQDADAPLNQMMAIRLSRLVSFTVRARHLNTEGVHKFWNPLMQSYSDFRTPATQTLQASSANPPEDVIKRWARDHLK